MTKLLRLLQGALLGLSMLPCQAGEIRIGIIGTDSSHAPRLARMFNNPSDPEHVPGGRVTVAFKGGSPDLEASWSRVDRFSRELQESYGVRLVDDIDELAQQVDAIIILSVDGRRHLEQALGRAAGQNGRHRSAPPGWPIAWRGGNLYPANHGLSP